eukprot:scaffold111090_cov39-Phaeocystis_antarctica.AAC.1
MLASLAERPKTECRKLAPDHGLTTCFTYASCGAEGVCRGRPSALWRGPSAPSHATLPTSCTQAKNGPEACDEGGAGRGAAIATAIATFMTRLDLWCPRL